MTHDDPARRRLRLVRSDDPDHAAHETEPDAPAPRSDGTWPPGTFSRMFDLTGRVALVVGGGGVLGGAIAAGLSDFGARLVIADVDTEAAIRSARACDRPGIESLPITIDITDQAMVLRAVEGIEQQTGRIDILVNAAGINIRRPATEYTAAEWNTVIDTNLSGVFYVTQAVARGMLARAYGRVLTLGSVSSLLGHPYHAAYAAAKGGIAIMTKSLATEWAPRGITVNALGPAYTETGLTREFLEDQERRQRIIGTIPMGRLGTPEDLVGAAVYLCSDAARFVTGQTLFIDGGRTAD
jgi:NAD(P)-dependent dehydrogenase (short-subunit alcohol dehydrogenase family)